MLSSANVDPESQQLVSEHINFAPNRLSFSTAHVMLLLHLLHLNVCINHRMHHLCNTKFVVKACLMVIELENELTHCNCFFELWVYPPLLAVEMHTCKLWSCGGENDIKVIKWIIIHLYVCTSMDLLLFLFRFYIIFLIN